MHEKIVKASQISKFGKLSCLPSSHFSCSLQVLTFNSKAYFELYIFILLLT